MIRNHKICSFHWTFNNDYMNLWIYLLLLWEKLIWSCFVQRTGIPTSYYNTMFYHLQHMFSTSLPLLNVVWANLGGTVVFRRTCGGHVSYTEYERLFIDMKICKMHFSFILFNKSAKIFLWLLVTLQNTVLGNLGF